MAACPRTFLALALLVIPNGCSKPNLPTKPPIHFSFTATVEIEGKSYPVEFTWIGENFVTLDEGNGWHTDWRSSQTAFVRILDSKYAIAVWLPALNEKDLTQFHPSIALIEKDNLQFLRLYPELKTDESRDGVFRLTELKIDRSKTPIPEKPMTSEEETLKKNIGSRKYGYLYGMRFDKDQWSQENWLRQSLSEFKGITPLGKRPEDGRKSPMVWSEFTGFNAGIAMHMDRHLFGFKPLGDSWTPLSDQVYWCRAGLSETRAPVRFTYKGQVIDQQQNELIFDEPAQQLLAIWRVGVEPLTEK